MVKFILNLVLRGNLQLLWHNAASARRCPSVGVGFFCVCTSRPFRYALVRAKSQNPAVDTRMSASDPFRSQPSSKAQQFATTHWSVVLTAGESGSQQAAEALEKLCRSYWYPLHAYVRREGHGPQDSEDLTQGFFARLLEKNYLDQVHPEKGRFRSFLLAALRHFLADEYDKARAQRRGGGQ